MTNEDSILKLTEIKSDIAKLLLKSGQTRTQIEDKMEVLDQSIILFEKDTPKAPKGISLTHEGRVGNCDGCNKLLFEWKEAEICRCGQKITWKKNKDNMSLRELFEDEDVSYRDFYSAMFDSDLGYWDGVNSTDTIYGYINEMMRDGISVSHILKALEENPCSTDDWKIWLGNSMNTPEPIRSKADLLEALELNVDGLE